jgi:hypothetical protein
MISLKQKDQICVYKNRVQFTSLVHNALRKRKGAEIIIGPMLVCTQFIIDLFKYIDECDCKRSNSSQSEEVPGVYVAELKSTNVLLAKSNKLKRIITDTSILNDYFGTYWANQVILRKGESNMNTYAIGREINYIRSNDATARIQFTYDTLRESLSFRAQVTRGLLSENGSATDDFNYQMKDYIGKKFLWQGIGFVGVNYEKSVVLAASSRVANVTEDYLYALPLGVFNKTDCKSIIDQCTLDLGYVKQLLKISQSYRFKIDEVQQFSIPNCLIGLNYKFKDIRMDSSTSDLSKYLKDEMIKCSTITEIVDRVRQYHSSYKGYFENDELRSCFDDFNLDVIEDDNLTLFDNFITSLVQKLQLICPELNYNAKRDSKSSSKYTNY